MLAKLGADLKKPNQQTVVPNRAIGEFLAIHDITKICGLGGKLGLQIVDMFGFNRVTNVVRLLCKQLIAKLGEESGCWVYDIVRGMEIGIVTSRTTVQLMLSVKTFVPSTGNFDHAMKWLRIFAAELMSRLNELQGECPRKPTVVALNHHIRGRFGPTRSKQVTIPPGSPVDEMVLLSFSKDLLRQICEDEPSWPCAGLSVSVSGFQDIITRSYHITSFFTTENDEKNRADDVVAKHKDPKLDSKRTRMLANRKVFVEGTSLAHEFQAEPIVEAISIQPEVADADRCVEYDCPKCGRCIEPSKVLEHLD